MAKIYIKTQGYFKATYNFRNDIIGETPSGWIISNGNFIIYETIGNHKKVLGAKPSAHIAYNEFTQLVSGIIEFYFRGTDTASGWSSIYLQKLTDASLSIRVLNNKWQYLDNDVIWKDVPNVGAVANDTWYHGKIEFDCSTDLFVLTIDGVSSGNLNFVVAGNYINRVRLSQSTSGIGYWDAFGYDWDENYDVGDNLTLEEHTEITSEVTRCEIEHKERDIPKCTLGINSENITIEPDDIILVRDMATSYFNARSDQAGVLYKGLYNFRTATLRSVPSGWTAGGVSTNEFVIDKFEEHARVVWLEDDQATNVASMYNDFASAKMSGTIELYNLLIYTGRIGDIQVKDGSGNICCWLRFDNDGNLYYITNNGANENALDSFTTYTGCTWYHIKLVFNATANTYDIYVDGTLEKSAAAFNVNDDGSGLLRLMFTTDLGEMGGIICFDSVDYSWATGYYDGRNKLLDVTLDDQIVFEGMIESADRQKEQKLKLISLSEELKNIMPGTEATKYEPVGLNPNIANQSEEVLAQIINEKCNTVKVKIWEKILRGNYSFENDINAALAMGLRYNSTALSQCQVLSAGIGDHQYILELEHLANVNDPYIYIYFKSQENGTIEWWMRTEDITKASFCIFYGTSQGPYCGFRNSGFDYYDGVWHNIVGIANNTWYRIRMDFECGSGGYKDGKGNTLDADHVTYIIYNAAGTELGSAENVAFVNPQTTLGHFVWCLMTDSAYISYIDAIGFSWSPFYNIGDNNHIYIERFETGALKMDLELDGSKTVKKISDTLADLEVFTWILTPDHYLVFTEGNIDSQVDLSASEVWNLKAEQKIKRVNKVWVKGGWGATNRMYGMANNLDSQATYGIKLMVIFYTISAIQSELNNIAQSLLTFETGVPEVISFWYSNVNIGFIMPLQTVTIPANTIYYSKNDVYIEGKQWILNYIKYLPMQKWCDFDMVDNLMFEYDLEDAQELEYLINNP